MVPEPKRIVHLSQEEFNSMPTGSLEAGVTYRIILSCPMLYGLEPIRPIRKPWEKWKQHPKGPRKGMTQARRQP
jgi:hypothetical protein